MYGNGWCANNFIDGTKEWKKIQTLKAKQFQIYTIVGLLQGVYCLLRSRNEKSGLFFNLYYRVMHCQTNDQKCWQKFIKITICFLINVKYIYILHKNWIISIFKNQDTFFYEKLWFHQSVSKNHDLSQDSQDWVNTLYDFFSCSMNYPKYQALEWKESTKNFEQWYRSLINKGSPFTLVISNVIKSDKIKSSKFYHYKVRALVSRSDYRSTDPFSTLLWLCCLCLS